MPLRGPDLHPPLALHPRGDEPVEVLRIDHERPHVARRLRAGVEQRPDQLVRRDARRRSRRGLLLRGAFAPLDVRVRGRDIGRGVGREVCPGQRAGPGSEDAEEELDGGQEPLEPVRAVSVQVNIGVGGEGSLSVVRCVRNNVSEQRDREQRRRHVHPTQ